MSVRRKKDGTLYVDIVFAHPDGCEERVRKVSPVQTKRGAEQYERELRQALLDGTFGKAGKEESQPRREVPTLNGFSQEFVDTYARTNNKPSSVEAKSMILRIHLKPALGSLRLDRIGPRELERYKAEKLTAGLSPKSINNHLTVLRRMLDVAREWEIISAVPKVKWMRCPKPKFDFFDFSEAERLVAGADGQWGTMILLALRTGLRLGELLALRWEDVDLVVGRLVVRRAVARNIIGTPKNGRTREIPLSKEAIRALKEHRHLRGENVFCDEGGEMVTKGATKRPLWRACRRAGLRRIGWHVLRHSFASHLVMRGVPIKAVQELMGHSTIEMTMRYAHLSPEVPRAAVDLLDQPGAPLRHHSGTEARSRGAGEAK
jgi:integrase